MPAFAPPDKPVDLPEITRKASIIESTHIIVLCPQTDTYHYWTITSTIFVGGSLAEWTFVERQDTLTLLNCRLLEGTFHR